MSPLRKLDLRPRAAQPAEKAELSTSGFRQALGQKIRVLRKGKDLTQAQVAALTRIGRSEISKLEIGAYNPGIETLRRVAKALEVSLASLFRDLG